MKKRSVKAVAILLAVAIVIMTVACGKTPEPTEEPINETAFHVAANGNDENDGSITAPFATPQKAVNVAKEAANAGLEKPVTVYIHGGEYKLDNLNISDLKGTKDFPVTIKAYKDEEVVFNAGLTVTMNDFAPVTDEAVLARLSEDAKKNVVVCDLTKLGLKYDDIGPLSPTGADATDLLPRFGETEEPNTELFWDDVRMTNARYPDTGFLATAGLLDKGDLKKLIAGTVILDEDTIKRMSSWQNITDCWMFSYPMFLWSESSTPITKVDFENNAVTFKYPSYFGYKESFNYYLFNVLEELTVPGEYYIDRDNMLLYFYPTENKDAIGTITVSKSHMLTGSGIENVIIDGLTFKGTRGDGINIHGDCITMQNCVIKSIFGNAASINGMNVTVNNCEAFSLGRGGFFVTSGDQATLTPGNSIIKNCYIHDYSQVYKTYMQAIFMKGCGNTVAHNEIAYAPHLAVSYYGPETVIEYNYIHDVCLESHDCGALYVGGDYFSCNAQIRFNYFKNIGHQYGDCVAIYFDDIMSNANIYGNIIDNCYSDSIRVNGGRDMTITNNLVISDSNPLSYNSYAVTMDENNEWDFTSADSAFVLFERYPYWSSELWQSTYPSIARFVLDYDMHDDINFPLNPSYSVVKNNIFLGNGAELLKDNIDVDVYLFSDVGYSLTDKNVKKYLDRDTYQVKTDELELFKILYGLEWEQIPFDKIGRNK